MGKKNYQLSLSKLSSCTQKNGLNNETGRDRFVWKFWKIHCLISIQFKFFTWNIWTESKIKTNCFIDYPAIKTFKESYNYNFFCEDFPISWEKYYPPNILNHFNHAQTKVLNALTCHQRGSVFHLEFCLYLVDKRPQCEDISWEKLISEAWNRSALNSWSVPLSVAKSFGAASDHICLALKYNSLTDPLCDIRVTIWRNWTAFHYNFLYWNWIV